MAALDLGTTVRGVIFFIFVDLTRTEFVAAFATPCWRWRRTFPLPESGRDWSWSWSWWWRWPRPPLRRSSSPPSIAARLCRCGTPSSACAAEQETPAGPPARLLSALPGPRARRRPRPLPALPRQQPMPDSVPCESWCLGPASRLPFGAPSSSCGGGRYVYHNHVHANFECASVQKRYARLYVWGVNRSGCVLMGAGSACACAGVCRRARWTFRRDSTSLRERENGFWYRSMLPPSPLPGRWRQCCVCPACTIYSGAYRCRMEAQEEPPATHAQTPTRTHANTHTHAHARARTHARTHARARAYTHTHTHKCMSSAQARMLSRTKTITQIHSHAQKTRRRAHSSHTHTHTLR